MPAKYLLIDGTYRRIVFHGVALGYRLHRVKLLDTGELRIVRVDQIVYDFNGQITASLRGN